MINSLPSSREPQQKATVEPSSFVVQYLVSSSENGGALTPCEYDVRAVSSTGEWKETRYTFDGKVTTLIGASDGLYVVSGNSRQYYGERNAELSKRAMRSEEALKTSSQFIRTEQLAGLRTYALRNEAGTEISYSPETGVTPLKIVTRSSPDDAPIHVVEALSVEFRELSKDESQLPDLPIRYDIAKQKVEAMRGSGQNEQAEMLQQAIDKLKAAGK